MVYTVAGERLGDHQRKPAEHRSHAVHHQDGATMAQAQIRKAVGGVVLAGRGERQQAAPRAGNGD